MSIRSICMFVVATLAFSAISQTSEAQSFRQLSTRRGAVLGAVIGGIAGNQNNETLAGVAIGGLVGGVAGRIVGNQAHNYYGGPPVYQPRPRYVQPQFYQPRYVQPRYVQPQYIPPTYYSRPVYSYGRSCGGY